MGDLDSSRLSTDLHRSQIFPILHNFHATNRAQLEKSQNRIPVVWSAIPQLQADSRFSWHRLRYGFPSQRARRPPEKILKYFVEPAQAAKTGSHRDLRHRHSRFVNQLFGEKDATRLRHRNRRSSQVLEKQTAQLAFANSQPVRYRLPTCPAAIGRATRE